MASQIQLSDGMLRVSGELDAKTVPQLLIDSASLFQQAGVQISVDLAEVSRADSSGLALLIDWMRTARQNQQQLTFQRLPAQLLEMARVSGIEELLPLSR